MTKSRGVGRGRPGIKRASKPVQIEGDIARVPLSRGLFATIDACDARLVSRWNWIAGNCGGGRFIAVSRPRSGGKRTEIKMHRLLLAAAADILVDHINGDPLDNRRSNLRLASSAENAWNSRVSRRNVTGFKGVRRDQRNGRYSASIYVNGRNHYLGSADDAVAAHNLYKAAALKHFGEFAKW